MDTDYIVHKVIRRIASWAVYSFFTEVRVIGGENVPANGPIIVYVFLSRLRPYRPCDWLSLMAHLELPLTII